ncbi:protein YceG like [Streptococcus sp. DD11]|uniref:endolytic transglycosylase MltG n=1 Tax=Streptococcus sp. DD11 TaxID=1777879 RepID=UPI000791368E|nr:endolytic transglycosylase MltG [Streptococcus sp. DD11]KXT84737.1 protein YceG like [Streptococcus sp. DD11]
MLGIMMKEVKFLTENSQDKEKNLSFREQILRDLAEGNGDRHSQPEAGQESQPAQAAPEQAVPADHDIEARPAAVDVSYKTAEEEKAQPKVYGQAEQKPTENLSRANRANNTVKKKRQNKLARRIMTTVLIIVLLGLAIVGVVGYGYVTSALKPVDANATEYVTIEVPEGSSSKMIGEILEKNGLIKNAQVFNLYSKIKSYGDYQSGYYNLQKSMDLDTIAKKLQEGGTDTPQPPVVGKVTIPEGYTLEQMAEAVTANAAAVSKKSSATPFTKDDFLAKVQDESFIAKMAAKYPQLLATLPSKDSGVKYRLEGYLFPATYDYGEDTDVESLIDQMLAAMDSTLSPYYSTIESKNLTVNEVLTIASLVEKEGSTDQDRKDIASVFYNRLNQAMPLQSNIAILYAQGKLGQKTTLKEDTEIDTNLDSPFNVYKNEGLMPGPVDSPSLSALEATINPSKTDYLYFVANVETGAVYFANTYEEHAKNVEEHVNSKVAQSSSSSS